MVVGSERVKELWMLRVVKQETSASVKNYVARRRMVPRDRWTPVHQIREINVDWPDP